jgi:SpoVK/Ycf46/Vps4 family AAA+-type ATPase
VFGLAYLLEISAGELPSCAGDLEAQLSRIFEIAAHWGAILLLDEADVFLERRSTQDLVRNGLVSVFLRKLEYCQAIMFMTTNRASQFDEAVLSRIHLMLRYEKLGLDAKREIWANFLKRAATPKGKVSLSKEHFGKLVSTNLNGREVRSSLF